MAVILRYDVLRNLLLGQPLEILQVVLVFQQVRLSGHDTALHEEGLLAQHCDASLCVQLGPSEIVNVVADWVVAHHPGVHIHASGLFKGSFSSLYS